MRAARKSSLYRFEVTEAAVRAVFEALDNLARPGFRPAPLDPASAPGRLRPYVTQSARAIDWERDGTATVLRKIRCSDGAPGVLDALWGRPVYLYDAHAESAHDGSAGEVIGRRDGAILRATTDGAVWIGHVRRKTDGSPALKLPATLALAGSLDGVPELAPAPAEDARPTRREIAYREEGAIGYLAFDFLNGAMAAEQCERLREGYAYAKSRPTRVIVLTGGADFWSNGIHLHRIEASGAGADESWRNINAMNDLAREIILTGRQLTIAAMRGNAGAGGVFLALAADYVYAARGVVLNPHYKGMGNLYGSEYWTYLLPRRVGAEAARRITQGRLPIGAGQAVRAGLVDDAFGDDAAGFERIVRERAQALAASTRFDRLLEAKRARRERDEADKPLERYREEELERMRLNFYGFDPSYHIARYNFVYRVPHSRTPLHLAAHRRGVRSLAEAA
jgi:putative two-component system hydrogenase maturation factor HypX/HoxX